MASELIYSDLDSGFHSRVRWGAVFAGVLIGVVTQVVLTLLGLAVGFTAADPAQQNDFSGIGIGSGIWLILSTIISTMVGAWSASWLANVVFKPDGVVHGILTWSLLLLLTLLMVSNGIGAIMGGTFNMVSSSMVGASQGIAMRPAAATNPNSWEAIQDRLSELLPEAGPAGERLANLQASDTTKERIAQHIAAGRDQEAADLISNNSDISQQEALNLVRNSRVETREVAQNVTDTASRVSWLTFLGVVLSLAAAAIGGALGSHNRLNNRRAQL